MNPEINRLLKQSGILDQPEFRDALLVKAILISAEEIAESVPVDEANEFHIALMNLASRIQIALIDDLSNNDVDLIAEQARMKIIMEATDLMVRYAGDRSLMSDDERETVELADKIVGNQPS